MKIYVGTLGQLVIVELFVLWIWFNVLKETIKAKDTDTKTAQTIYNKLFLTSIGLVFNAAAIAGIMVVRYIELLHPQFNTLPAIIIFYSLLAIGNFMFILSAALGSNMRLVKAFFIVTGLWTAFVVFVGFN